MKEAPTRAEAFEAKTWREVMDNKYLILAAACIGAVAAIAGGIAVGMNQFSKKRREPNSR